MHCKISGIENGPLEIDCTDIVFKKEGQELVSENPAYACRCGRSKSKPWCDGSHESAGFVSQREITEEKIQEYIGKEITVHFNRSICAGAAACVNGLPTVFSSEGSRDWIHPDQADCAEIIETIKACPSGALSYSIDGKEYVDSRTAPKITIVKNGPYRVEGISLEGMPTPTHFASSKYTLCRCAYSKNKPYCDYSHAEQKWDDTE